MPLRKLGKQLTQINVAVSGAILLTIAFVALGVTESIIVKQYENDLNVFTRWFLQTSHEAVNSEEDVRFRLPAEYAILAVDDSRQIRMMGGLTIVENDMEEFLEHFFAAFSERLKTLFEKERNPFMKTISADTLVPIPSQGRPSGFRKNEWSIGSERSIGFFIGPEERIALRISYTMEDSLLMEWKKIPLRVSATLIQSEKTPALLLILQDRRDELAAGVRLRGLFAGIIAGGMLVIVVASMYISARAIRPIEQSIKQQQAFVAAASHELRTPVAALLANVEVLRDAPFGEYAPYLESVRSVGERLSSLISDMVDLARADVGELSMQKTPVDAGEAAEQAVLWMRPLAERKGIGLSVSAVSLFIQADPDRLRQALLALLDNAIRYSERGCHVDVTVAKKNQCAEITVSDNGSGIPDEQKARIFERFYRLDEARSRESGGAGLGLSVAKRLVEQMEGNITLSDRMGGGACFHILFKLY